MRRYIFVARLRVGLVVGAAILMSACGAPKTSAVTSSAAQRATSSPAPSATVSTASNLLFAVLESQSPSSHFQWDTVAILGRDGYARAKAHFQPLVPPDFSCAPFGPILSYAAADKVFYIDGQGVVRSLSSSGAVEIATTFPITSSQQEATFAVSPDGSHLMGAVWTFPPHPAPGPDCAQFGTGAVFQQDVYSAVVGQSAKHLTHDSWPQTTLSPFLEFIGWDSVGPIGANHAVYARQGGLGGGWHDWAGDAVRVDSMGRPGSGLLAPGCDATVDVQSGGFVCYTQGRPGQPAKFSVRSPDGSEVWHFEQPTFGGGFAYPVISPNRRQVAIADQVVGADGSNIQLPSWTGPSPAFVVMGWLDGSTLIGWTGASSEMALLKVSRGAQPQDLGFQGSFVSVFQGG